jgi:hypothetical protein
MHLKRPEKTRLWWLSLVILATQEAEIRVRSQPGEIFASSYLEKPPLQKRADGVAQGVVPEFKLLYHKKTKQNKKQPERKFNFREGRRGWGSKWW